MPHIQVGIGVMIFKDGKVLLGQRKGSHGAGEFSFPGGALEHGESFEACARREVREECGLEIDDVQFLFVSNLLDYLPKHYVHMTLTAKWCGGEPEIKEPEKSESWGWYALDNLPKPLFTACALSFDSYAKGIKYYDSEKGQ